LKVSIYYNYVDYDDDDSIRQDVLLGVIKKETYVISEIIPDNLDEETINLICQGLLFRDDLDPLNTNFFWTKEA
jgi:hypothetical protein